MASSNASLNPRTKHDEFLGPLGALFITLAVPATTYALYFGCSELNGGCPPKIPLETLWPTVLEAVNNKSWWISLYDPQAAQLYLGWYTFCVAAWLILPGDWVEGTTMRNGQKKQYKINGESLFARAYIHLIRAAVL